MYVLASVRIALRALRINKLRSALTMQGKLGQADEQGAEISTLPQDRRTVIRAGATKVKDIRGTLRDQRLATQFAVRSMLTPGRWTRWLELRTTKAHRGMRRGWVVAAGSPLGITEHILITQ